LRLKKIFVGGLGFSVGDVIWGHVFATIWPTLLGPGLQLNEPFLGSKFFGI